MGNLYVVNETDASATDEDTRRVDLLELRPAEVDNRRFSGSRTRAIFALPRGIRISGYALAGFHITESSIDAQTLYLLDQKQRLWFADLSWLANGSVPKPALKLIPGKFSALQREASGEVFAIDENGRLTMLTVNGPAEPQHRLVLPLEKGEFVQRINGTTATGLQLLTSRHRVLQIDVQGEERRLEFLSSYSLLDGGPSLPVALKASFLKASNSQSPALWDIRGNPSSGDFWVLDEATPCIWLRTQANAEGERFWVEYDLNKYLTSSEEGNKVQILGMDADSLYLRAGPHYRAIRRVSSSPLGVTDELLFDSYFTQGLFAQGIFSGLFSHLHVLQPHLAERGKSTKRRDIHVRDVHVRSQAQEVNELVDDFMQFVHRNGKHMDFDRVEQGRNALLRGLYGPTYSEDLTAGRPLVADSEALESLRRWKKVYGGPVSVIPNPVILGGPPPTTKGDAVDRRTVSDSCRKGLGD